MDDKMFFYNIIDRGKDSDVLFMNFTFRGKKLCDQSI